MLCNQVNYDVCVATLSVCPHRASLKNMPGHGGIRKICHRGQAYFSSLPGADIHSE